MKRSVAANNFGKVSHSRQITRRFLTLTNNRVTLERNVPTDFRKNKINPHAKFEVFLLISIDENLFPNGEKSTQNWHISKGVTRAHHRYGIFITIIFNVSADILWDKTRTKTERILNLN